MVFPQPEAPKRATIPVSGKASEVWALSAYHKAFIDGKYGYGSAISLILILVVLVLMIAISIVNARMERRNLDVQS